MLALDAGFYVQGSFFPIKQKLELYGVTSQIYGDDDAGFGDWTLASSFSIFF